MFYKIFRKLCRIWFKTFFRLRIIGTENIPREGAFILAANHVSNWDPPFLGTFLEREISYMAKMELLKNPVMSVIYRELHVIPVKRGLADRNAIKCALKTLNEGKCLGIFPEGRRSKNGELGKAESGVSLIASMSGAPIIPAAIVNTNKIFSSKMKFPNLSVIYGKPLYYLKNKKDKESLENFAQSIMLEISKLKESLNYD